MASYVVVVNETILSRWLSEDAAVEEAIRVSEYNQCDVKVMRLVCVAKYVRGAKAPEANAQR